MDGTFVQKLTEQLARPVEVGGYVWHPTTYAVKPAPLADALQVYSLGALVAYVKANRDDLVLDKVVVHVVSPQVVKLLGPLQETDRTRETYVQANATNLTDNFLGKFVPHEEFIIGLQTRFEHSDVRAAVLKLLGNIKTETVKTSADDGVTQTVSAKAGVVMQTEAAVPNPVALAPYRTFREVVQPASLFVLRVQQGHALPSVGLFEADGGAWRLQAIEWIGDWLSDQLPDGIAVLE